jgi:subtilisin-like proprotein convertase family protein
MSPPVLRCAALFFPFFAARVALAGPALANRYDVRDGGQWRSFEPAVESAGMALYETGRERKASSRRLVTSGVLVRLQNPAEAAAIAARSGARAWKPAAPLKDAVILSFDGNAGEALPAAEALRAMKGVLSADPILARQQTKRWTPNDPFFAYSASNAGYQWHLKNTGHNGGAAGIDIDVETVWDTWRGSGIRIAIIDDGLQTAHPDLAGNVDTVNDYDWNGSDDDPSPSLADIHGTGCAGLAAGRGDNAAGVCGAAPEATLVGLRLISGPSTDETESAAFLHRNDIIHVKNNSWGPDDDGDVIEGPGPLGTAALAEAAASGRGGRGTITLWAGGNGRANGDDSNFDGYANSIYVIATGAVTDGGTQADYSEPGANLLITTPSSGGAQATSTTDLTGSSGYNNGGGGDFVSADYTNRFGGTSAASPLAAGAVALLLQSNPNLGWRDVKEILARSATKNHAADAGWFTNAAGFHFNDKYGAGLINIEAAVNLAAGWASPGPMVSHTVSSPGAVAIPDNSAPGAEKTFVMTAANDVRVEQAAVAVDATHARRGQLEITLSSPAGTVSRLARPRTDNRSGLAWTFTTPQFWGERSPGTWTLRVRDTANGNSGTLNSASLTLYGTGASGAPAITSSNTVEGQTGAAFTFQPAATNSPSSWSAASLPPGLTIDTATGLISGVPAVAGEYSAAITATNAAGSGSATLTITISGPPVSLAEALDAPELVFTGAGTSRTTQATVTQDGIDAARSGSISDGGSSSMQTSVTGPVTVAFWWQVSSEFDYDKLRFFVDGEEVRSISGNVTWTQMAHYVPAGLHTLRWSYEKDVNTVAGLDAGWVDVLTTQSSIVPLTPGGYGTGFQEPALNATLHLRSGAEIGWIAGGGKVAEAGNRSPPLTGAVVTGTPGVKSFDINNAAVTLRTDIVDLSGFSDVGAEADVRTFTTSSTSFEAADSLRIYLELSGDALTWTDGPDILALRSGGIGDSDTLIALNTGGTALYHRFTTPAGAVPAETRYARIVVSGATDGPSEHLVIDNLRLFGTLPVADADGDGFTAEIETWFGTSDADAGDAPSAMLALTGEGAAAISFPSVPGNDYAIDVSDDLVVWSTESITASAATTTWTDANGADAQRRYFKVRKP